MHTTTLALTLASLLSTAFAGTAYITNDCNSTVYVQHVDQVSAPGPLMALAAGGVYSEPIVSSQPGVALKVWNSTDVSQPSTELDFTLTDTGAYQALYWGLGGSADTPFAPYGFGIIPSGAVAGSSCDWDFCSANEVPCGNLPGTRACPVGSDLNLYVCSG
jgi:hypothetical protein